MASVLHMTVVASPCIFNVVILATAHPKCRCYHVADVKILDMREEMAE